MDKKTLDMFVECLHLRMTGYKIGSDAHRELQNTIDMLTAKCYQLM
jgi:hypothetical protein